MKLLRILLFPFSVIYWIITSLRNSFYRAGIFKASKFSVPIISVGNLSVGGTGKTPHIEYLIRLLSPDKKVATLSRGFGRKKRGFIIADEGSTAEDIGDEPLQFFKKFGDRIKVVVEANRVKGVMDLMYQHEDTEVVLLDDAYQHRAIDRGMNILLTSFNKPYYSDWILPVGELREAKKEALRADLIIVTKSPEKEEFKKENIIKKINPSPNQKIFFSSVKYGEVISFDKKEKLPDIQDKNIVLVTGIANTDDLVFHVEQNGKLLQHIRFKDHHRFNLTEIQKIHNLFDNFVGSEPLILTTEKDAMRLMNKRFEKELKNYPWFYQKIEVVIDESDKFDQIILDYVETNR